MAENAADEYEERCRETAALLAMDTGASISRGSSGEKLRLSTTRDRLRLL